ncbi:MAG: hypothetical protein OXF43_00945 [Gammaproteobacteria bacterium]|nr:hypothetical protein [Gammaproteobacteria bacterium]
MARRKRFAYTPGLDYWLPGCLVARNFFHPDLGAGVERNFEPRYAHFQHLPIHRVERIFLCADDFSNQIELSPAAPPKLAGNAPCAFQRHRQHLKIGAILSSDAHS